MDRRRIKYFKLLLIDDDNNSKIFVSELNKYYIRGCNKSIHVKILNKFEDINSYISHKISVIDMISGYYENYKYFALKHCTILLTDDNDHSKIFISKKNSYFTSKDCDYFDIISVIVDLMTMSFLMKIMIKIIMIIIMMIIIIMMMVMIMMIMTVCIIKSLLIILSA